MNIKYLFHILPITAVLGNFPVPAVYPESCNSTEYYDSICTQCKRCGKDYSQAALQTRTNEGVCVCISDYYAKNRRNSYDVTCSPCPTRTVPSKDGSSCLECGDGNPFNETAGRCEQCVNGTLVESDKELVCVPCPLAAAGNHITHHSVCPSLLRCTQPGRVNSGGVCLPFVQYEPSMYIIKYEIGEKIHSAYFDLHLNASLHLCKENEDSACQALANMCVLLLYRLSLESNACSEFRKIAKRHLDQCPTKQLWLYYIEDEVKGNATRDLYRENVPNRFVPAASEEASRLQIIAKQYALNGSLIGIKKVQSDDLNLCQDSNMDEDISFRVGTRIQKICTRSLQNLWYSSQLTFNDLYLANPLNKSEWYPIPVLISGVVVNGDFVNKGGETSKWLLVRRYFLTDHVSGVEEGQSLRNRPVAKVFRYAADVSLKITFKPQGSPGTIYPPLLTIAYAEATPDDILMNKKVTVKFSVSYEMDQSSVRKSILITLSIFGLFSFVWSCLQLFSWYRRAGKTSIDLVTLGKFIIFICGNLASSFFIVIFIHCLYWFSFFKKQNVFHTMLPTPQQEYFLSVYIGIAFAMKAVQLTHLLFVQCNVDIFFIDWERPRFQTSSTSARSTSKGVAEAMMGKNKTGSDVSSGISIWRTYYVANEWSEIQSKRKTSLSAQLFGVLFILKVLDFESYSLAALNLHLQPPESVPHSACCRFALGCSVYLLCALLQVMFRKVIYERFVEDKLQQYVDLCSVSNVSVFILLTKRFGYYIHGRSTHGKADVNMREMHEFLRKEEEDLCGHRGLLPDTQQQTFQFILPPGVHDQFFRLLAPLTSYSQTADRMQGVGGRLARVDIDRVASTHYMLNKFLSGFIDHSFKDLDYVVKDRVMLESIFDTECFEVANRGYFYNDDGRSFSNVTFYGNESTLLLFDVLLFSIVDIACSDFVLSATLTFMSAKLLQGLRHSIGRRNLVRKALIDERFLT